MFITVPEKKPDLCLHSVAIEPKDIMGAPSCTHTHISKDGAALFQRAAAVLTGLKIYRLPRLLLLVSEPASGAVNWAPPKELSTPVPGGRDPSVPEILSAKISAFASFHPRGF